MRLTPLDIKKQEFKRVVRGFDRDEVNTFLEMIAEEFEALMHERSRLSEEIVNCERSCRIIKTWSARSSTP